MKVAFLFNPSAQSGVAGRRWAEIESLATELELDYERIDSRPDGETVPLVRELTAGRRFDTIAACGGDGTISEVINGMMQARTLDGISRDELAHLAVIPFGTGNNIAKSFNISTVGEQLRRALETIRYGAEFRFDLGRIDERWVADGFSIGVDCSILKERNTEREKVKHRPILRRVLRDYNLYMYAVLRVPFRHKNIRAEVRIDDAPPISIEHLTNLIVNNVKVYAGEFIFDPDSRANDGLLDVILFTGWRDYLSKFIMAARISPVNPRVLRRVLRRRSTHHKASRVVVRTTQPVDSQVDGEEHRRGTEFILESQRDALTLKTPVG